MARQEEYKDLSQAEAASLAGAIWIHGSIDIEHSRKRGYYYPRIMLSMTNPLPYHYKERIGDGKVYRGKEFFTLQLKKQEPVEKRLQEILPFMGGEEEKQIEIALQIIKINRSEPPGAERKQKLETLYDQWKRYRDKLEDWIKKFKAEHQNVERRHIPVKIWNRAYRLEDC